MTENTTSWLRSPVARWLLALLLPPVGLVLLWRGGSGILRKLAGSAGLAVVSVVYLVVVFELRVELAGTGMTPIFYFGDAESGYEELERHRAAQRPAAAAGASVDAPWPRYRGPRGDGRYDEMPIRTDWPPQGLPELWKQPIGGGYASLAIAGGLAFTLEQRRQREVVAAYELRSGREVWSHGWEAAFSEPMGGDGPRTTPTWDDGRLYVLGALGELRALRAATGELLWRRNALADAETVNLHYAQASSPFVLGGVLIVQPGGTGEGGALLVAYDKLSGEVAWTSPLTDRGAYATPELVTLAGEEQLLVVAATAVLGLRPGDGTLLWRYPWVTQYDINAAQPLPVGGDRLFISSGYGHGAALVEVAAETDGFAVRTVWENTAMKNRFATSVLYQGNVYGLDERILTCLDLETGERRWKGGRYGHGQLLLAGSHLVVLSEKGEVVLVEATPEEHREVARFAALSGKTWNVPAIGGGVLLVRNSRQMAAYDIAG